jgi:beta-phosphoglucomutase-like phosphatase (HAD superfamily)
MPVGYRGAIFDVDGVLVDSPHERAWRETADLVVTTLDDVDLGAVAEGRLEQRSR